MRTLCVILARAGSKGLPGKNTRLLGGKPLVAWTIEHALAAKKIDRAVLSTDGPDIAEVGHQYEITVIDRPVELAGDTASVVAAAHHAVETIEQDTGTAYDAVIILYGNVPLRPADLIDEAVEKLESSGAHSVQSVCPVGKFHPYWMKTLGGADGDALIPYQPNQIDRRQDLPPVYQLDGGVIVVRRENLSNESGAASGGGPHAFLGIDQRAVVTEPGQVIDIDSATDLAVAEAVLSSSSAAGVKAHDDQDLSSEGSITIGDRLVGDGLPAYVIAELGVNHDGSIDRALELTQAAKQAGANAVKLQLFEPQLLLSREASLAQYQSTAADDVHEMLAGLQLSIQDMASIRAKAKELGLGFIVTCFSIELVEQLRDLDVDAVKIASPDAVNLPLIESLQVLDKPMLISTGACELEELNATVEQCRGRPMAMLQCVSAYPVPPGQSALRGIDVLRGLSPIVGYSDHTSAIETGVMAATRGACVIEKHLTHDCSALGPDHAASLDLAKFTQYVDLIRAGERELGLPAKTVNECEREVRRLSRQSVCVTKDLPAGHVILRDDVTVKRPGTAIPAARLNEVVGMTLRRPVQANHLLRQEDLGS